MKNIILIGACRAGKTTLLRRIVKEFSYQCIDKDVVFEAFLKMETDSAHAKNKESDYCKINIDMGKSSNLLKYLYQQYCIEFSNHNVIVDAGDLSIEELQDFACDNDSLVIAFGYPNVDVLEKMKTIRRYETEYDWTICTSDFRLKMILEQQIEYSKYLEKECQKNNIMFVDTTYERYKKIDEIIDYIRNNNI